MSKYDYLLEFKSVRRWVRGLGPRSVTVYLSVFGQWWEWVGGRSGPLAGLSPDELVEYQAAHRDYAVKDLVQEWVEEQKHRKRAKTLRRDYSVIHSFFLHNRAPLPPDIYRPRGGKPPVVGKLTVDMLRRLILASNPLYRAVFTCMAAGIMGAREVLYWSDHGYESLVDQLERGERVVVAWQSGRKKYANTIPFYNLVGGDALTYLKVYLEEVRPPGPGPIFRTKRGDPLTYPALAKYWNRRAIELGLRPPPSGKITSRYGVNIHEIRDVMRTRWRRSPADVGLAEFMMGHVGRLDPNEYDKIYADLDYAKREYRKALPWLNIVTEDPEKVPRLKVEEELERYRELEERVEAINKLLTDQGFREEFTRLLLETEERVKRRKAKNSFT